VEEDCKRVCAPEIDRPFAGIVDTVQRLLPYHVRRWSCPGFLPVLQSTDQQREPALHQLEFVWPGLRAEQILASEEGEEADLDEATAMGMKLVTSRRDVWRDACLRRTMEFGRQIGAYEMQVRRGDAAWRRESLAPMHKLCASSMGVTERRRGVHRRTELVATCGCWQARRTWMYRHRVEAASRRCTAGTAIGSVPGTCRLSNWSAG
jgi:Conserved region of unknown function on GLTSCR protein